MQQLRLCHRQLALYAIRHTLETVPSLSLIHLSRCCHVSVAKARHCARLGLFAFYQHCSLAIRSFLVCEPCVCWLAKQLSRFVRLFELHRMSLIRLQGLAVSAPTVWWLAWRVSTLKSSELFRFWIRLRLSPIGNRWRRLLLSYLLGLFFATGLVAHGNIVARETLRASVPLMRLVSVFHSYPLYKVWVFAIII